MAKIQGIHYPAELKNLAINGAFDYFQRYETSTAALVAATSAYCADMFLSYTAGTTAKSVSAIQSTTVPSQVQSGFQSTYSLQMSNNTGITLAASDTCGIEYRMEGLDYEKIHAKTMTVGFWFYSTLAGTYPFYVRNQALTRSYVTTFTSAASTWQFITMAIPLDTVTASWTFNNTLGMAAGVSLASGTTFQTAVLNTWQAGNYQSTAAAANWLGTAGNNVYMSQFSIVESTLGFGPMGFSRQGKSVQQELALCQRYYEKSYDIGTAVGTQTTSGAVGSTAGSGAQMNMTACFRITKRIIPTCVSYNPYTANSSSAFGSNGSAVGIGIVGSTNAIYWSAGATAAAATCAAQWVADAGF